ncbi:Putative nuclease HARBI1 [Cyphomyrmex costatus]|uniref:Putative nuclease HARBI1 n=1 Tax=Cyphomyrmex costatus TaxID=456900 RepID=A0A151IDJ4_9HYME|nr:Putative nuclease HARBI1 [Cyphomyrmex costatus]
MSFANKYHFWVNECNKKLLKRKQLKEKILITLVINEIQKKTKRNYSKKRYWVEPIFQERRLHGFYHAIFPIITLQDSRFRNYFRMSVTQFEELLCMIAPFITKQTVIREPISAEERLCMTLRFLASGDSMTSISYQYLVGLTTVSKIIEETCNTIWNCLVKKVLPSCSKQDWLNIANEFEEKWNFNHCIGAIDGKHVLIQCPNNAGSSYFNYKYTHSIVLLGICDANYCFTYVDIGAYGRRSDGGIFKDSLIGQKFHNEEMDLPQPQPLISNGESLPYVLVGDEAFQLTNYLLRPYPGKNLNKERTIYNYRLSRARRIIENTFGIIESQWRILKRPIICNVEKSMTIIQAIVCLHNWIRKQDTENQYVTPTIIDREDSDGFIPGSWREDAHNNALIDIHKLGSNNCSHNAMEIREQFCEYFNNEGAVTWQTDYC